MDTTPGCRSATQILPRENTEPRAHTDHGTRASISVNVTGERPGIISPTGLISVDGKIRNKSFLKNIEPVCQKTGDISTECIEIIFSELLTKHWFLGNN
jgi:hypothetical protein